MPQLIDYSARFDLVREAAFTIVLRDGVAGLTFPAIADELHTSLSTIRRCVASMESLPRLAFQWIERRERRGFDWRAPGEISETAPWAIALNALVRSLPFDPRSAENARVRTAALEHDRHRDWATAECEARSERLASYCAAVHKDLALPDTVLDYEKLRLQALVEGLISLVCASRLAPEDCAGALRRHVLDVRAARRSEHRGDAA